MYYTALWVDIHYAQYLLSIDQHILSWHRHGEGYSIDVFLALSNHPVTMATRACVLVVDLLMTTTVLRRRVGAYSVVQNVCCE